MCIDVRVVYGWGRSVVSCMAARARRGTVRCRAQCGHWHRRSHRHQERMMTSILRNDVIMRSCHRLSSHRHRLYRRIAIVYRRIAIVYRRIVIVYRRIVIVASSSSHRHRRIVIVASSSSHRHRRVARPPGPP